MSSITRLGLFAYALAAVVLVLDQLSKLWIIEGVGLREIGQILVPGPMNLTWTCNEGVSFGLLRADNELARWALTAFQFGVAIVLSFWVRKADKALTAASFGLIIGGAIGNAIDRARMGCVADFLDFDELYFPWIFNVADAAINIGIGLLIIDALVRRERAPATR